MPTPLQDKSYELFVRTATLNVDVGADLRIQYAAQRLFQECTSLVAELEAAFCASHREHFQQHLYSALRNVRVLKVITRLLDDVGRINPEAGEPLEDAAEEVHRLVLAALRTSKNGDSRVREVA